MIYVIGDIHGCYEEFMAMLDKIEFDSEFDMMYCVGDYIDRGKDSYKMMQFVDEFSESCCFRFIRGNHEQEFITNMDLLNSIDSKLPAHEICEQLHIKSMYFDTYGTIRQLIKEGHVQYLTRMSNIFRKFPLYYQFHYRGNTYIIVHAGFSNKLTGEDFENFVLYARDEAYTKGGVEKRIIISGHTPTIVDGEFSYNDGNVFKYERPEIQCTFYNIDCGCCFKDRDKNAKLACIRLDDNEIFYV